MFLSKGGIVLHHVKQHSHHRQQNSKFVFHQKWSRIICVLIRTDGLFTIEPEKMKIFLRLRFDNNVNFMYSTYMMYI